MGAVWPWQVLPTPWAGNWRNDLALGDYSYCFQSLGAVLPWLSPGQPGGVAVRHRGGQGGPTAWSTGRRMCSARLQARGVSSGVTTGAAQALEPLGHPACLEQLAGPGRTDFWAQAGPPAGCFLALQTGG